MIVLDTNILSEPMRRNPDPVVGAWLDVQAVETLYVTTITLAEIRYGILAMPMPMPMPMPMTKRRHELYSRFEDEVLPVFEGRTLDFDEPSTIAYGELRSRMRAAGRAIGDSDALIAAIATVHGFAVATRDGAPFEGAGLRVVDPFAAGR